jgi:hypothetical protein
VGVQGLVECIKHLETFVEGEAIRTSVAVAAAVSAMAKPINSFAASISDAASNSLGASEPTSCSVLMSVSAALDQLATESGYCCNRPLEKQVVRTAIPASDATGRGEAKEPSCSKTVLETGPFHLHGAAVPAVALHPALHLHAACQQLVAALSTQHTRLKLSARVIADEAAAALADLSTVIAGYVPAPAGTSEAGAATHSYALGVC